MLFHIVLMLVTALALGACSQDDDIQPVSQADIMRGGFHVGHVDFSCNTPGYDDEEDATRAVNYSWADGATLFARLKSGSTYLRGFLTYHQNEGWTLMWWGDLATNTSGAGCELYYLETGGGNYYAVNTDTQCFDIYNRGSLVRHTDIPLSSETIDMYSSTAVYYTTTASYTNPGDYFTIKATLYPMFWRLRFQGSGNINISLPAVNNDIRYCTAFNWTADTKPSFTKSASNQVLSSSSTYTTYLYGEFSNYPDNKITIKNGEQAYQRTISSSELTAGTSGCLTIPTEDNYATYGWTKAQTGLYVEEPYQGWGVSVSNAKAATAAMGYEVSSESSTSFMLRKKDSEYFTTYNHNGHSLTSVDVWFKLDVANVSKAREYLTSKLNYTYTGKTASGSVDHYNYLSLDGRTKASVHLAYSGENVIITFEPSDNGMLFEEPYTVWGASTYTLKSALSAMGYTLSGEGDTSIRYNGKYKEWFTSYYLKDDKLDWITVFFKRNVISLTSMCNYLSTVWKFTDAGKSSDGKKQYYMSLDGRIKVTVYDSDDTVYIQFHSAT